MLPNSSQDLHRLSWSPPGKLFQRSCLKWIKPSNALSKTCRPGRHMKRQSRTRRSTWKMTGGGQDSFMEYLAMAVLPSPILSTIAPLQPLQRWALEKKPILNRACQEISQQRALGKNALMTTRPPKSVLSKDLTQISREMLDKVHVQKRKKRRSPEPKTRANQTKIIIAI